MRNLYLPVFIAICLFSFGGIPVKNTLRGKIICIDAGHGGTAATDSYRKGPTGEREEWINLRVALQLKKMLEDKGAKVLMTRVDDSNVAFDDRINLALTNKADVFLSIHHNATADSSVNFPIIYYHGNASENKASVALGKSVAKQLQLALYQKNSPASLVSDHTIFPTAGTKVLRGTYGIPGVIAEASFFTHPPEEERLKNEVYNQKEAKAFVKALENYFNITPASVVDKYSMGMIPPFQAFQEAGRMSEIAKKWYQDYEEGKNLMKNTSPESLQRAYDLFTRSARSFPDSFVAGQCHQYRAEILDKLGKKEEAANEARRVKEFYVPINLYKGEKN